MIKLFDLYLSFEKDALISGKCFLGLCSILYTRTQKLKNVTHIFMKISIHEIKLPYLLERAPMLERAPPSN